MVEPPTLARILDWFRDLAARNSDGALPAMEYVVTTCGAGYPLFDALEHGDDPELPAVVMVAYGKIVGYTAKLPRDGKLPRGAILFAVRDGADASVLWGIRNERVDLAPLGDVRTIEPAIR